MATYHIVGVDPGLVHTGVVRLLVGDGQIYHAHALVPGLDPDLTQAWISGWSTKPDMVLIEKYEPRHHFSSDGRMVQGEAGFKKTLKGATLLRNTGIKHVVTQQVLTLLGLWDFSTTSHHQDLRAAARIAVFGMMKVEDSNKVLAHLVRDALDGSPWPVTDLGGGVLDAFDAGLVG